MQSLARLVCLILPAASVLNACGHASGGGPAFPTYSIGGAVQHLNSTGLMISDGTQTIAIPAGSTAFVFNTSFPDNKSYDVTVSQQPSGETCEIANGSGSIAGSNVNNINVVCSTLIAATTPIGIYPVGSATSNDSKFYLPINMVGVNAVTINAMLDSGSAGAVLDALDIFPSNMVSASGFVFPSGQDSVEYNGITVTNVVATRSYGAQSANPTVDTGNLGFAQITFGGPSNVTTAIVPILFVYQVTSNGQPESAASLPNRIGISPDGGEITVANSGASSAIPTCTPLSVSTCGTPSPFRYLTYGSGLDKGIVLKKTQLVDCSIDSAGSCPLVDSVLIGLDGPTRAGFSTTPLDMCHTANIYGSTTDAICSQLVDNVTISAYGGSYVGPGLFDSGEAVVRLEPPQGSNFPASVPTGTTVVVTTPSQYQYEFKTGTGYLSTIIEQNAGTSSFTNLGIAFFTLNSLLIDYSSGLEGWAPN